MKFPSNLPSRDDRLKSLIEFANADVSQPGWAEPIRAIVETPVWFGDLSIHGYPDEGLAAAISGVGFVQLPRDVLLQLQTDVRKLLETFVETRTMQDDKVDDLDRRGMMQLGEYSAVDVQTRLSVASQVPSPTESYQLWVRGSYRDVTLAMTMYLVAGGPNGKIRRCPECSRIFARVKRQTHCSPECYDAWYWRKYPSAKKRAHRKNQYAKHGWTVGARSKRRKSSTK
jgi:hypothetical protein